MTTADSGLYLCHKNLNAADQKTVDGTQSAATSLEIRATIRHLIKIIGKPNCFICFSTDIYHQVLTSICSTNI